MSDLSDGHAQPVPGGHTVGSSPVGLVIDWGGVLTGSLDTAMSSWANHDGVDFSVFREVMRQWAGGAGVTNPSDAGVPQTAVPGDSGAGLAELEQTLDPGSTGNSPVHRLERGEIETAEFERELAAELTVRGSPVPPTGLLARLMAGLADLDPRMVELVHRARVAGLRTALLSNSWGRHYPEQLWDGLFDAVVISGEVGMRKPEPQIFHYTADQLQLPLGRCVMVDDLPHNIVGAVAAGMLGVLHRSYDETLLELEALFEVSLS